jgi:hypothetical protein
MQGGGSVSITLFPSIQPQIAQETPVLPLYREAKWDFVNNIPFFRNGSPVIVDGKEAVLVWAWKALNTPRFKHEIYTWNYGNDIETLIGKPFTDELKQSEAARYVRECLMINPYITGVTNVNVTFTDGEISISCKIETIYGEAEVDV